MPDENHIFRFGPIEIDTELFEIRNSGTPVSVEPQVFDVLAYLVKNRDRVVTKQELFENVWQDTFVGEAALSTRIMEARKAIGDTGSDQRLIRTLRSRGYRFVGEVQGGDQVSPIALEEKLEDSPTNERAPNAVDSLHEGSPPIGRVTEMKLLLDAFESVSDGNRRMVLVSGEAGIGKSTLLEAFRSAVEDSSLVIFGQSVEHGGDKEPYMPVLSGMSQAGRTDAGALVASTLERVAPTWLLQIPTLVERDQVDELKFRSLGSTSESMMRQFDDATVELASHSPVVLLIEDLHWADASTVGLIQWLAQRRDPAKLLVVGTYRTDFQSDQSPSFQSLAGALHARSLSETLHLDALDDEPGTRVLKEHLGITEAPADLCSVLVSRADGNPLFMKAILDDWMARGDLKLDKGKCLVTVPFSELERHVPSTLSHLIENVVDGLPTELRHVLDIGSVAGDSFSADEISVAVGLDAANVESACESVADNIGFIAREDVAWEPGVASARYRFAHSLHREILYSGVTTARRAEFHMAIGDSIEMLSDPNVPEIAIKLAYHYTRANNAEKAIKYLKLAAERAIERNALNEAYDSLSTALRFVTHVPADEDRKRIELALLQMFGNVAVTVSGWSAPEVEQSLLRAETLARDLNDDENLALVLYGLATMRELLGQYRESEELLNAQLEIVNSGLTLEAHELLACSTFHQGKFSEALDHAAKGLATYEPLKHHSPHLARYGENLGVSTNTWAALALWFVGRADEAIGKSDLALEYATTQVYSLATAQIQRAFLHQFRVEPQECLKWAIAAKETATEQGFPFRLVQAEILLQWALLASGEPGADIESLIEARKGYDRFGAALDAPYFDALVAEQEIRQSRAKDALGRLDKALERLRPSGNFFYEPEIMRFAAHGMRALGHNDGSVVDKLAAAAERANEYGALPLELRATVDLYEISADPIQREALTVKLQDLLGRFETGLDTPDLVAARRAIANGNTGSTD